MESDNDLIEKIYEKSTSCGLSLRFLLKASGLPRCVFYEYKFDNIIRKKDFDKIKKITLFLNEIETSKQKIFGVV